MAKVMTAVTVDDSATEIVSAQGDRSQLLIHNNGADVIYLGDENVTVDDGFPFAPGERAAYRGTAATELLYGVSDGDEIDVRVEELYGGYVDVENTSTVNELRGVRLGLSVLTDDDLTVTGGL